MILPLQLYKQILREWTEKQQGITKLVVINVQLSYSRNLQTKQGIENQSRFSANNIIFTGLPHFLEIDKIKN